MLNHAPAFGTPSLLTIGFHETVSAGRKGHLVQAQQLFVLISSHSSLDRGFLVFRTNAPFVKKIETEIDRESKCADVDGVCALLGAAAGL